MSPRRIIHYIDSQQALDELSPQLSGAAPIGFDTEFLRERTYHPTLCLAQVAVRGEHYLIDPLSEIDCSQFWAALLDEEITLHAGRQDIEVLVEDSNRFPTHVFDTQIAAGLVGLPPQVGYAALVDEFCDVQLAKAHTRTNWSRRPLDQDVLRYAADDVRYLEPVRAGLSERAESLGRMRWIEEDCAELLDADRYAVIPEEAWHRLRGLRRLPQRVQQRAIALAAWRESEAIARNLPRQWVIRDEALIDVSFQNPQSSKDLAAIPSLDRKSAKRHGSALIVTLNSELPAPPEHTDRPDAETRATQKAMAQKVRELGAELKVESEVLAPQRELKRAAVGDRDIRALRGWRAPLLAPIIEPLMPN
ncbi:MAG: ribonuclease D [Pseudomonadota bacterium]